MCLWMSECTRVSLHRPTRDVFQLLFIIRVQLTNSITDWQSPQNSPIINIWANVLTLVTNSWFLWINWVIHFWRHNGRHGVSNLRHLDYLLNHLFRRRSKKIPKLRVTDIWKGNPPVTGELPTQRASNAEMYLLDDVMMYFYFYFLFFYFQYIYTG